MLESDNNWKPKVIVTSTLIGTASGLVAGLLLSRTAEEKNSGPPRVQTKDALRITIGIIGIVRGIAALGDPD